MAASDERARLLLERTEALRPRTSSCRCTACCGRSARSGRRRERAGLAAAWRSTGRSGSSASADGSSRRATASASARGPAATSSTWCSTARSALVESIEQDLEGNFLVSVVLEEDPGAYLGLLRQPGHRFFFAPEEVEQLPPGARPARPAATRTDPRRGDREHLPGRRRVRRRGSQAARRAAAAGGRHGRRLRDPRVRPGVCAGAGLGPRHPGRCLPSRRAARHGVRARARPRRPGRARRRAGGARRTRPEPVSTYSAWRAPWAPSLGR